MVFYIHPLLVFCIGLCIVITATIAIAVALFNVKSDSLLEREIATTIAIAIVGRVITIEREIKERYIKNEAKKIKSDNLECSIRKKSNIAIAILKDW